MPRSYSPASGPVADLLPRVRIEEIEGSGAGSIRLPGLYRRERRCVLDLASVQKDDSEIVAEILPRSVAWGALSARAQRRRAGGRVFRGGGGSAVSDRGQAVADLLRCRR